LDRVLPYVYAGRMANKLGAGIAVGARISVDTVAGVLRRFFKQILENVKIAADEQVPMCQDTGVAVVFLENRQEVRISGGYLYDAINEGVRNASPWAIRP